MSSKIVVAVFVVSMCALLAIGADDHAGQCWVESEMKGYAPGEKWSPAGECVQLTCVEGGGIKGKSCGSQGVPPGYHEEEHPGKPWPECCPTVVKD